MAGNSSENLKKAREALRRKREAENALAPPGVRATNPGLEKLKNVVLDSGRGTGLESDPAFAESMAEDAKFTGSLDTGEDAESLMESALEEVDVAHDKTLGNGKTIPYPDPGEDTTDFSTCRKPIQGINRGCAQAARKPRPCPFVGKGPVNFIYLNKQTGLIKHCPCVVAMRDYLKMPHIVFLDPKQDPPGESWVPTRMAHFAPLPNGQQPVPGPGQPKTRIVHTPHKCRIRWLAPEGEARVFQQMRRRGDFDTPPPRRIGAKRRIAGAR